jgi:hypothetical protein
MLPAGEEPLLKKSNRLNDNERLKDPAECERLFDAHLC